MQEEEEIDRLIVAKTDNQPHHAHKGNETRLKRWIVCLAATFLTLLTTNTVAVCLFFFRTAADVRQVQLAATNPDGVAVNLSHGEKISLFEVDSPHGQLSANAQSKDTAGALMQPTRSALIELFRVSQKVIKDSTKLQWLHIPKAGTSFGNMLVEAKCKRLFEAVNETMLPLGFDDTVFNANKDNSFKRSVLGGGSAISCAMKEKERCRAYFSRWGLHDPVESRNPILTMFRDPYDRIVSGYFFRFHSCAEMLEKSGALKPKHNFEQWKWKWQHLYWDDTLVMNNTVFLNFVRKHYARGPFSIVKYAQCVSNCQTKMLGGFGKCNAETLPLKAGDEERALKVLDEQVLFGGITERWHESAELLYSLFGAEESRFSERNVRPSLNRDKELERTVRATLVAGHREIFDEVLYERAVRKFESLLNTSRFVARQTKG